mgnify:CR=1 FL=1
MAAERGSAFLLKIGDGTRLISHVSVAGRVTMGRDNVVPPFCVIGGEPQDISYAGSDTRVIVGNGNIIREGVTINRASEKEDGVTWVGDDNFLMAGCHVAHDCRLGNRIIMANGALLGLVGYTKDDLAAGLLRWPELTPPESMAACRCARAPP